MFIFVEIFFFRRLPELFRLGGPRQSLPLGRFRGGRGTQKVGQAKRQGEKCPGMSRSQQAGPQGPAVTGGGECLRIMYAGSSEHTVRHRWKLHTDPSRPERGLKVFTELRDAKRTGGWGKAVVDYCPAFERPLSKLAKERLTRSCMRRGRQPRGAEIRRGEPGAEQIAQ